MAVIKALNAIAPAIVCRNIYYPGAKHLVAILQALLPGIDMVSTCMIFRSHSLMMSFVERPVQDCE
jgi:hypothetical protein